MSVLNDVLKNLDEQKAQQRATLLTDRVYEVKTLPWYVWGLLGFMFTAIVALSVQVFFLQSNRLDIPDNLYDFEPLTTEASATQMQTEQPISSAPAASTQSTAASSEAGEGIVRKTQSTRAQEAAITALQAGETEQVKKILVQTEPTMRQNLNLRVMLKETPEKVVPYLQTNEPGFMANNELLALAAQAQQRAGEHRMAVVYYQQLIKRQPSEARWHAGLAISLDGLGERDQAISIYQSVLNAGALPAPLKRFVQYRLKKLDRENG